METSDQSFVPFVQQDEQLMKLNKLSNEELLNILKLDKTKYKANSDYLLREVAGESLLIPLGIDDNSINGMISVNETFVFIWKQFSTPKTVYEVVQTTLNTYQGNEYTIMRDIYRLVLESTKIGLIREEK